MTKLPFKVRLWKRKLENERVWTNLSATLARRVFYAGCFFYLSFLAHGYFVYDNTAALALNPDELAAYLNRGLARNDKRDFAGAAADLEKALAIAPKEWMHRATVEATLQAVRKSAATP